MAKRKLGLGNVNKAKKQKQKQKQKEVEKEVGSEPEDIKDTTDNENLLTVELSEEVNPNDSLSQLSGLWSTWEKSDKDNELILNGVINECDRILRNCKENGGNEDIKLIPEFYSIYSQSLSEISKFKDENKEEISEWFKNSFERLENGFDKFDNDIRLLFTKCKILLTKIAVEYISKMDLNSKRKDWPNMEELLREFIKTWLTAIKFCETEKNFKILKEEWVFEILNIFDDLLDLIDKFGNEKNEVVDSDNEEDFEDLNGFTEEFELSKNHPLYEIQNSDEYNEFWRESMTKYLQLLNKNENLDDSLNLRRKIMKKLGQSYLMEAEEPIAIFTSFAYDDDKENDDEQEKEIALEANKNSKKLVKKALEYLHETWDDEDPKSWVDIAEAEITYGNLYEVDSEEQENLYKEAEKKLKRANNATHGKYQDILDSLVGN